MGTFSTVEVLGQTVVASTNSTAVGIHHSDRIAVQSEWTDLTGSAKTALTGVNQVDTLTFASKASSGAGDYVAITDTNGDKWAVALSKAGIAEVSSITTIAEGSVAEKTQIITTSEGKVKNVTQAVAVADVSASLAGTYFKVGDTDGTSTCGIWFSIGGVPGSAPAGATACTRAVEVAIAANDSASTVAGKVTTAFGADVKLVVGNVGATITLTDAAFGTRVAAADGAAGDDTGFAITTTAVGAGTSTLHQKYFILKDEVDTVGFWFDVDNAGASAPTTGAARNVEITGVNSGMTAAQVGTVVYNAIHADSKFNGDNDAGNGIIRVVSTTYGNKTGQSGGDSGFTVSEHTAGAASNITGKYFLLGDVDGTVGVWFDVGNEGTSAPTTGAIRDLEVTTIARGDTAAQVATKLRTALDADSKFDVGTLTDATFTAICKDLKSVANIAAGDSGFTVSTTTQGSDLGAEPTGAIWAAIPAAKRVQADISADTTDANVASRVRTALAGITGISAVITVGAASGATIPLTQVARGPVAIPVPKSAADAGAGSITAASPATTPGVASTINVSANTITIASHGWTTGLKVQNTIDGGSLPTGVTASEDEFVIVVDANTIKLADTYAAAIAGTARDITNQGTGGQIITITPTAIGGGVIHLEGSVDGITYFDIASMTANMTGTSSAMWNVADIGYMYVRVNAVVTAGQVYVVSKISQKGCCSQ